MLTTSKLRQLLEYNPTTGLFRWQNPSPRYQAKSWFKGNKSVRQYRRLYIDGRHYMAHTVAWAIHTGKWPTSRLDHKNRDQNDNRWKNLRLATQAENARNRSKSKHNTTGFRGVSKFGTRFRAQIGLNNKHIHIGLFDRLEDAFKARKAAERHYYGEYAP